jgi:polygalacturonase
VLIKNCDVSVGDDNFTCSGGASDILITHCTYGYGHGVSIGSHTVGEISNITVEDCTFSNTEAGIRIKTDRDRGGHVHDLTYRDLKMTNVNFPILIYESYMATDRKYRDLTNVTADIAASYPAAPVADHTPVYENLRFINITATAAAGRRAALIWGLPESPVNNVLLQNVNITADKPMGIYNAKGVRLINTTITTPDGVNKLSTANAEVSVR